MGQPHGVVRFLNQRLKLKVNSAKSAVDCLWNRSFLGYAMTRQRQPRLKVSAQSVKRFKGNLKSLFRRGRGRPLSQTIAEAMPVLPAGNGRGLWWNVGASHMNQAGPTATFRQLGLTPLIEQLNRLRYTA